MRISSGERVERLLAAIPWIVANDGPTVEEVAERFDYPLGRLIADLETVFMVGVPPYTPDSLITVIVEDGRVWIDYADFFDRPLRLTPDQALALLAACSSLLEVSLTDPDPLRRGLDKLAQALGLDLEASLEVQLGTADPGLVQTIRDAISDSHKLEIDYYAFGRDARARRVVRPHRVFASDGQWYLTAYCELAEAERQFRLDRIHAINPLDEPFEPADDGVAPSTFRAQEHDARVDLLLEPGARWVADVYPVEAAAEVDDGCLQATLAVSAVPWLERLLLQLGGEARVVATRGDLPSDIVGSAARRLLARYEAR